MQLELILTLLSSLDHIKMIILMRWWWNKGLCWKNAKRVACISEMSVEMLPR